MNNYNNRQGGINAEHIFKNGNTDQFFIMEKWSRLVGKVLSNVEIAISEGKQYDTLRKSLNVIMYNNSRDKLIRFFQNSGHTNSESMEKIEEILNKMKEQIDIRLEMAFPQAKQQEAMKSSIEESIAEIKEDIFSYFEEREEPEDVKQTLEDTGYVGE